MQPKRKNPPTCCTADTQRRNRCSCTDTACSRRHMPRTLAPLGQRTSYGPNDTPSWCPPHTTESTVSWYAWTAEALLPR
eukprot:2905770-Prymnesium_polylepis.1